MKRNVNNNKHRHSPLIFNKVKLWMFFTVNVNFHLCFWSKQDFVVIVNEWSCIMWNYIHIIWIRESRADTLTFINMNLLTFKCVVWKLTFFSRKFRSSTKSEFAASCVPHCCCVWRFQHFSLQTQLFTLWRETLKLWTVYVCLDCFPKCYCLITVFITNQHRVFFWSVSCHSTSWSRHFY